MIGVERLIEKDERQEFGDVIHLALEEVSPRMPVVFDARRGELVVVARCEDFVVSVGIKAFDQNFLFDVLGGFGLLVDDLDLAAVHRTLGHGVRIPDAVRLECFERN